MKQKRLYLPSETEGFAETTRARQVEKDVYFSSDPRDFGWIGDNIPCQAACPVITNIPGYIRTVFEKRYGRSYEINRYVNIFPGVLGRVCSRPCEPNCRHGWEGNGDSVAICHLKRVASDYKPEGHRIREEMFGKSGKSVAVIGSGPAGLGAAHDLAIFGHQVELFEALEHPGGMLRYGIPAFRLPRDVLQAEIDNILRLGVILHNNAKVGVDVKIEELLDKFDAVMLATGAYKANVINMPGADLPQVYTGLDFMMRVNSGETVEVGKIVQVIGGGYTAMDCARAAMRLGAKRCFINVLSAEEFLLVDKHEALEVKTERVDFRGLVTIQEVMGNGKVERVKFKRNRLGGYRPNGEREGTPIEGSDFETAADCVILAIGQRPDSTFVDIDIKRNKRGAIKVDSETRMSSREGLFLGGDFMTGASTIIEALGSGRRAAQEIDKRLMNKTRRRRVVRFEKAEILRERSWDFIERQAMPTLKPKQRMAGDGLSEVESGLGEDVAHEESKRCYLCYLKFEIDTDRCIFCRWCIEVAPKNCILLGKQVHYNKDGGHAFIEDTNNWNEVAAIAIDNKECIRCGACLKICPVQCIDVVKVELIEQMTTRGAKDAANG